MICTKSDLCICIRVGYRMQDVKELKTVPGCSMNVLDKAQRHDGVLHSRKEGLSSCISLHWLTVQCACLWAPVLEAAS